MTHEVGGPSGSHQPPQSQEADNPRTALDGSVDLAARTAINLTADESVIDSNIIGVKTDKGEFTPVRKVTIKRERTWTEWGKTALKALAGVAMIGPVLNPKFIRSIKKELGPEERTIYEKAKPEEVRGFEAAAIKARSLPNNEGKLVYDCRYQDQRTAFAKEHFESAPHEFLEIPGKGMIWTDDTQGRIIFVPLDEGGQHDFANTQSFTASDSVSGMRLIGQRLMRTGAQFAELYDAVNKGLPSAMKSEMGYMLDAKHLGRHRLEVLRKILKIRGGRDEEIRRIGDKTNVLIRKIAQLKGRLAGDLQGNEKDVFKAQLKEFEAEQAHLRKEIEICREAPDQGEIAQQQGQADEIARLEAELAPLLASRYSTMELDADGIPRPLAGVENLADTPPIDFDAGSAGRTAKLQAYIKDTEVSRDGIEGKLEVFETLIDNFKKEKGCSR